MNRNLDIVVYFHTWFEYITLRYAGRTIWNKAKIFKYYSLYDYSYLRAVCWQAQDLQSKMENAGGEELKQKKALVEKLQKVGYLVSPSLHFLLRS